MYEEEIFFYDTFSLSLILFNLIKMCHRFLKSMGNRATKNVKSVWLDRFPIELIYHFHRSISI